MNYSRILLAEQRTNAGGVGMYGGRICCLTFGAVRQVEARGMKCLVVIVCPKTGQEVPTGVVTDIESFADLPRGKSQFQCAVCGDIHEWSATDAMLAQSSASLTGAPSKAEDN